MGDHEHVRTPHATWLPGFVALLAQRFGDRLGRVRPTTALLAAERTAIELDLDSVIRLIPLVREGADDSEPVRILLSYIEGTHPSGAYSIPPARRSMSGHLSPSFDVHRIAPRTRSPSSVRIDQADTLPPPPMPTSVDVSAKSLVDRAIRLFSEGHSDAALRLLAVAVEVDPDYDDAYRISALVAESLGRHEIAAELRRRR